MVGSNFCLLWIFFYCFEIKEIFIVDIIEGEHLKQPQVIWGLFFYPLSFVLDRRTFRPDYSVGDRMTYGCVMKLLPNRNGAYFRPA